MKYLKKVKHEQVIYFISEKPMKVFPNFLLNLFFQILKVIPRPNGLKRNQNFNLEKLNFSRSDKFGMPPGL